jgi:hypothetical protein
MVASGLATLLFMVMWLLATFSGRSFAAMANYVALDQEGQLALDKMSREVREAHRLTDFSATALTFEDKDYKTLQFIFDPTIRALISVKGGVTNTYLANCDSLTFTNYQKTTISNTFDAYQAAYVTNTRLIQVTWTCSRNILGARVNTESVQSAKIAIRNND